MDSVKLAKNLVLWPVERLKPYDRNARTHSPEQVDQIAASIAEFGFTNPILVDTSDGIIAGHGRLMAAQKLGLTEVPVVVLDHLSDAQRRAYIIADNKLALNAGWDDDMLADELRALDEEGFDLGLTGFSDDELAGLLPDVEQLNPQSDEDAVPDALPDPKVVRGEVYILGKHRLMCGDSTAITDVERLMGNRIMDITFTSPPYNAAKNGHLTGQVAGFDKKYEQHSDELSDDEYFDLLSGFTGIAISKSRYAFVNLQILTHNRNPLFRYQAQFKDQIKDILVWNKKQCPPNIVKGAFNTKWEYVFVFSHDTKTRGFPCDWQGKYPNVVETESNSGNEFAENHKAGFPIAFPAWFLEKFEFAKSIYEPFCGTGTTIIAAEKFRRECFGMELDPRYCGIILERWQKYTGKKAYREDGKSWDEIKAE